MASRKQHPAELRERAVAMVFELSAWRGDYPAAVQALEQGLSVYRDLGDRGDEVEGT
jgi:hypothetical protein